MDKPITDKELQVQSERKNLTALERRLISALRAAREQKRANEKVLLVHRLGCGVLELYSSGGVDTKTVNITRWQDSYRDKIVGDLGPPWSLLHNVEHLREWNREEGSKLPRRDLSGRLGTVINGVMQPRVEVKDETRVDTATPSAVKVVPPQLPVALGKGSEGKKDRPSGSSTGGTLSKKPGTVGRYSNAQGRGTHTLDRRSGQRPGQSYRPPKSNS